MLPLGLNSWQNHPWCFPTCFHLSYTNLQFKHVQRSEIAENLYQNHLHGIRGQGPLAGHQQLRQVSRSASSGKLNLDKAQELLKGWTSGDLAIRCSTVDV